MSILAAFYNNARCSALPKIKSDLALADHSRKWLQNRIIFLIQLYGYISFQMISITKKQLLDISKNSFYSCDLFSFNYVLFMWYNSSVLLIIQIFFRLEIVQKSKQVLNFLFLSNYQRQLCKDNDLLNFIIDLHFHFSIGLLCVVVYNAMASIIHRNFYISCSQLKY